MLTERQLRAYLTITRPPEIPVPVWNHAVYVARNMVGTSALVPADLCDLVQEFCIAVIRVMPRIRHDERDPQATTYLSRIIDRQSMRIYRERIRSRIDSSHVQLADCVAKSEKDDHEVCAVLGVEDTPVWLHEEIGTIVNAMPQELRSVCLLFMDGLKAEEIARVLNVSPATIRTRRMPKIRRILGDAGYER